ncbi:hypothetical protein OH492_17525 [Vibrio chagasii]|nr:hypothetical protein [Vibrio chagasii]
MHSRTFTESLDLIAWENPIAPAAKVQEAIADVPKVKGVTFAVSKPLISIKEQVPDTRSAADCENAYRSALW